MNHHWQWELGVQIQPVHQITSDVVEKDVQTEPQKKSMHVPVTAEVYADPFFRHLRSLSWWCGYHTVRILTQLFTLTSFRNYGTEFRKRTELWENNSFVLHHNNSPSHCATVVEHFFGRNTYTMPQTAYLFKPTTYYSSLFANDDETTFSRKKLSFTKCEEKRSTHYSSWTTVFTNVCSDWKYGEKFFEFFTKRSQIWQITLYTLFVFRTNFIHSFLFRQSSRIVCSGLQIQHRVAFSCYQS